ncbi:MAG: hypothetical protein AAB415_03065 [Patescibacteria group bacterium]
MNTKTYASAKLPNLVIQPALRMFIKRQVKAGRFRSESEAINFAVKNLRMKHDSIWLKPQEEVLSKVWDNSTDATYDTYFCSNQPITAKQRKSINSLARSRIT